MWWGRGGNESCSRQLARAARLDLAISWVSVCSLCRRASLLVWRKGKGKAVKTSEFKFYGAGRRQNKRLPCPALTFLREKYSKL